MKMFIAVLIGFSFAATANAAKICGRFTEDAQGQLVMINSAGSDVVAVVGKDSQTQTNIEALAQLKGTYLCVSGEYSASGNAFIVNYFSIAD